MWFCLLSLVWVNALADTGRIAVASNFSHTARQLAKQFEQESGLCLSFSVASTGKLYAQIRQGAPFDLFLAADQQRPQLLFDAGKGATPFTYALGQLVLWGSVDDFAGKKSAALTDPKVRFIAIANPNVAPYGEAAKQALKKLQLWPLLETKLVRGENLAQTLHYVRSGNAQLGFVSLAQVLALPDSQPDYWPLPEKLYPAIVQQGLLLSANPAAVQFSEFMQSEPGRALIAAAGYRLP